MSGDFHCTAGPGAVWGSRVWPAALSALPAPKVVVFQVRENACVWVAIIHI